MQPTEKSPEIERFLEEVFGRTSATKDNRCVFCAESITGFRDRLSEKEYRISGLCQNCQDKTFGKDE